MDRRGYTAADVRAVVALIKAATGKRGSAYTEASLEWRNLMARVDRYTNLLWEAQVRDFVRWPRLGSWVWPNPDGPNRTTADSVTLNFDVDYTTPTTYSALIGEMKKWITGRFTWVDNQFLRPPALNLPSGMISPGATLTIAGTLGSIYYTLDGTDPRAPGGAVSPSAYLYTGPIT